MKILVTGGAGFIGSHVADILIKAGHDVVIVDNLHTGHKKNLPLKAVFYEADICDEKNIADIFKKECIEAVSHHAALANVRESMSNPIAYAKTNLLGTLNLLEAARLNNCEKFVFASTGGAVYGEGFGGKLPFTEKSLPQPKDNYGANKLSAEYHIDLYCQNYGLKYTILRYSNIYGPRQDSMGEAGVVAIFCGAMSRGIATRITGDGKQTRDFTCVIDVAKANLLAIEKNVVGIFNIGTGFPADINTIHKILTQISGYKLKPSYISLPLGEVVSTYLDNKKAKDLLEWKPKLNLEDGLKLTYEWFQNQ